MKLFIVQSYGYTHCPEFNTLPAARAYLRGLVAEELANARRKSKTARKHLLGRDSYSITLGSDSRSALWSQHNIANLS